MHFLVYAAALVVVWYVWWRRISRLPEGFPPGPRRPLPVIGSLHAMGGDMYHGFRKLRREYGDIYGFHMGPRKVVVLNTYELIQEACSKIIFAARPPMQVWEQLRQGSSLAGDVPGEMRFIRIVEQCYLQ